LSTQFPVVHSVPLAHMRPLGFVAWQVAPLQYGVDEPHCASAVQVA